MCCQVEVSATDWSLVQGSPTDCSASLCVITKPRKRGDWSPLAGCESTTTMGCDGRKTNKLLLINTSVTTYSCRVLWQTEQTRENLHPSVPIHVQIKKKKILIILLVKIVIQTTLHRWPQRELQHPRSYTKSYSFPTRQVLKFHRFCSF